MNTNILRTCEEVCELINIKRSTLYILIKYGLMIPPIKIGKRLARWRRDDVIEWSNNLKVMQSCEFKE